jgi:D-alanyl-D-alanine carboxypeptidase
MVSVESRLPCKLGVQLMWKNSIGLGLLAITICVCGGCMNSTREPASPVPPVSGEKQISTAPATPAPAPAPVSKNDSSTPAKHLETTVPAAPPTTSTHPANDSENVDNKKDPAGQERASQDDAVQVVANPDSITVLLNKQFGLPNHYKPKDLVELKVPFISRKQNEKHLMRKEAAAALEVMFAAAKKEGILLKGVSAYRSNAAQTLLFNRYVQLDGVEKARMYSAVPGTSEHETGLAIDIAGSNEKCAASDCFAGSKEALWLDQHAAEYGFIIRYPKGKEAITGYQYEPWHIRYVGKKISKEIAERGITLEEYFHAAPAAK